MTPATPCGRHSMLCVRNSAGIRFWRPADLRLNPEMLTADVAEFRAALQAV